MKATKTWGDWLVSQWRSLSVSQSIVLLGLAGIAAVWLERRPAGWWEALAEKDPTEIGLELGAALLAFLGVLSRPRGSALILCAVLSTAVLSGVVSGCGASAATREGYSAEVARCVAAERAIVDREGTSEEEDREALALERSRCDAALAAIGGAP